MFIYYQPINCNIDRRFDLRFPPSLFEPPCDAIHRAQSNENTGTIHDLILISFVKNIILSFESNYFNSSSTVADESSTHSAIHASSRIKEGGGSCRDRNEAFTHSRRRREEVSSIHPIPTDVGQSPRLPDRNLATGTEIVINLLHAERFFFFFFFFIRRISVLHPLSVNIPFAN